MSRTTGVRNAFGWVWADCLVRAGQGSRTSWAVRQYPKFTMVVNRLMGCISSWISTGITRQTLGQTYVRSQEQQDLSVAPRASSIRIHKKLGTCSSEQWSYGIKPFKSDTLLTRRPFVAGVHGLPAPKPATRGSP